VLNALANQAVGLVRQEKLSAQASEAAALAEADRLRRALLSAVSHDLRTPLAAAKAAVSSLRSDDVQFSPTDTAELLATVEESIDQLTTLVGNLLDSSRLAAGVIRPALRTVYLDEVVHRALTGVGLSPRGYRHQAVERVKVDVGSIAVQADAGLLERVVANLVDNALRYAGERADVRVDAARDGERVTIRVIDTGPGIDAAEVERLFDPFQRLGDRDNTSGVGLGLSVVHGFVEAMGGTVEATDTPGGGVTMIVELAAADARVEPVR
jgi:two-component system sensor histidine kinase KdpD